MPIEPGAAPFFKKDKPRGNRTLIWCPLRTCRFNDTFRCKAFSIKLRLFSDGRFKCMTYKKKPGIPRALDYFDKEYQNKYFEEKEKTKEKDKPIVFNPDTGEEILEIEDD